MEENLFSKILGTQVCTAWDTLRNCPATTNHAVIPLEKPVLLLPLITSAFKGTPSKLELKSRAIELVGERRFPACAAKFSNSPEFLDSNNADK